MALATHNAAKSGRRHPLATAALIAVGLLLTGAAYVGFTQTSATAEDDWSTYVQTEEAAVAGEKLFAANCATCHGMQAQGTVDGPSLIGVGAASVNFQVGTGRMPLAFSGPQGMVRPAQFSQRETIQMAAFVAKLGPGPGLPEAQYLTGDADVANGGALFRINCAMCHNVAGAGGALTEGKYAPPILGVEPKYIYEAMITGPQNMPVFNDHNISPQDKANIITYLKMLDEEPSVGGYGLGNLGPVSEGLFIWIFGLGAIVGITVWLTAKSN